MLIKLFREKTGVQKGRLGAGLYIKNLELRTSGGLGSFDNSTAPKSAVKGNEKKTIRKGNDLGCRYGKLGEVRRENLDDDTVQ